MFFNEKNFNWASDQLIFEQIQSYKFIYFSSNLFQFSFKFKVKIILKDPPGGIDYYVKKKKKNNQKF